MDSNNSSFVMNLRMPLGARVRKQLWAALGAAAALSPRWILSEERAVWLLEHAIHGVLRALEEIEITTTKGT